MRVNIYMKQNGVKSGHRYLNCALVGEISRAENVDADESIRSAGTIKPQIISSVSAIFLTNTDCNT
ncbi:hypothetical protein ABEB36_003897 [Hypothenemus hampei]|uniref:Uncharacterized protein n=1 Tax=Hypothenemus hampei TaxID=57062 RepID=A0ABD1F1H3_HYPHA